MTINKAFYILANYPKNPRNEIANKQYKSVLKTGISLLCLGIVNLAPSLIAHAATVKNTQPKKVICQPVKLGYEEALWFTLAKPQQEYDSAGTINLYEDARMEVLARGVDNWLYVKVIASDAPKDIGLEGWVKSVALKCNHNVGQVKPAICEVTGLQSGKLALRTTPGGKSEVGLDNGNNVTLLMHDIPSIGSVTPWIKVRVDAQSNPKLGGREGWINADYVMCYSQQSNDAINYP
jgi:hypothetical protein